MKVHNLREFISLLENRGQLRRINIPVSSELEITEIADRTVKSGGPALLFENVSGYNVPVVINLYGSLERIAWALGVEELNQLTDKVQKILGMLKEPPSGMIDKIRTLGDLVGLAGAQPKIVNRASCQDVTITDEHVDLNKFPILKCWPMDSGRFITLPLVISRDPETGRRNVGTYRMQVYDNRTTGMHWQTHKVGARHSNVGKTLGHDKIPVAVAIGCDPTTMWSGSLPLPPDMDEIMVSGVIRGKAVEMVRCKTIDLEVPADSEIVLEGYVNPNELRTEGPFGDHTGYYSPAEDYSVFHVTAITHRQNPIYATTIVGRPPTEDYFMGKASERLLLPALKLTLPEVVDINMPAEGIFHNLVLVSIKKEYPGHARKVMYALWGLGLLMLAKNIVIVDEYVDVQNLSEVTWRVSANIDPMRDVVFSEGPVDDLDHATDSPGFGSKMGIDATAKGSMDGRTREWPSDIEMSENIKKLVERKWKEYGI